MIPIHKNAKYVFFLYLVMIYIMVLLLYNFYVKWKKNCLVELGMFKVEIKVLKRAKSCHWCIDYVKKLENRPCVQVLRFPKFFSVWYLRCAPSVSIIKRFNTLSTNIFFNLLSMELTLFVDRNSSIIAEKYLPKKLWPWNTSSKTETRDCACGANFRLVMNDIGR